MKYTISLSGPEDADFIDGCLQKGFSSAEDYLMARVKDTIATSRVKTQQEELSPIVPVEENNVIITSI